MKKVLVLLCIISMMSVMGCSSNENSSKEITSVEIKTTEIKNTTKNTDDIIINPTSDAAGDTEASENTTEAVNVTENETAPVKAETELEEKLIWEFDNVKVYAKGIENGITGPEIKLLVENNSDKDIRIYTDDFMINDFMITDICSIHVTAGNKSNDTIDVLQEYLDNAKINRIGKIEMSLYARDDNSSDKIAKSDMITLYTSDYDESVPAPAFDGTTLVEQSDVKIVALGMEKIPDYGTKIHLYIENNTEKAVSIRTDDFAVNGFMTTEVFSAQLLPGKKIVANIDILDKYLDENGITSIDNIETIFIVKDKENYKTILKTDKISFST